MSNHFPAKIVTALLALGILLFAGALVGALCSTRCCEMQAHREVTR